MSGPSTEVSQIEQLVMLAILRLGENAYGVAIQEELHSRIGREVSLGSLYACLGRLSDKGFTSTREGEPTPERGGRRKTFYKINGAGRRALQDALFATAKMKEGLGEGVFA